MIVSSRLSPSSGRSAGLHREVILVIGGFVALSALMTYPLAFNLGSLGYKLQLPGDPQYSVWNVAWVAHALLTNPLHVLDANIFYPHRGTLIYSETNLIAGAIGVPAYALTNNPFAAHNFAVLMSFALSAIGMYALVRHLLQDRVAAIVAAIIFAYCPYAFAHLSHIQLLMTAGIPFTFLSFHRMVDRPTHARGLAFGATMGLQAFACAYYSVFLALTIPVSVAVTAWTKHLWRSRAHVKALLTAATTAVVVVTPLLLLYAELQRTTGFRRALTDATRYSASWSSYLTSSAYAARWIYPHLPPWTDVLFPGFLALVLALAMIPLSRGASPKVRQLAALYATIGAFALWESFGPDAWLYRVTYRVVPALTFLRAPSRFGVMVVFSLSVLAAIAVSRLRERRLLTRLGAVTLVVAAIAEHAVPVPWTATPAFDQAYTVLADQPYGAVVELPVYSHGANYFRTQYMVASTVHWKPLVNAYSDVIPLSFSNDRDTLATFPSRDAFKILEATGVRYVVFHLAEYSQDAALQRWLADALREFSPYLRLVEGSADLALYEIVGYPSAIARAEP